jgi:hypothetical protein
MGFDRFERREEDLTDASSGESATWAQRDVGI